MCLIHRPTDLYVHLIVSLPSEICLYKCVPPVISFFRPVLILQHECFYLCACVWIVDICVFTKDIPAAI